MRRLLAATLTALLLASCGGDDDPGESAERPASASVEEERDAEEPAGGADDEDLAAQAVLRLSDFEPGWREEEPDPDEDDDEPDCEGFDAFEDQDLPSADSKKFVKDEAEVENSVGLTPSEEEATRYMDLLARDSTVECLRGYLEDAVEEGVAEDPEIRDQFDDVTAKLGRVSVEQFGDRTEAFQVEVVLEGEEISVSAYVDLVFVQVGRALTYFSFLDVLTPFEGDRAPLVEAVVERLADAA